MSLVCGACSLITAFVRLKFKAEQAADSVLTLQAAGGRSYPDQTAPKVRSQHLPEKQNRRMRSIQGPAPTLADGVLVKVFALMNDAGLHIPLLRLSDDRELFIIEVRDEDVDQAIAVLQPLGFERTPEPT